MRKLFGLMLWPILFGSVIYAQGLKEYRVRIDVSSMPVMISSVNPPKILERKFVRNDPMQSYLLLELSGTLEVNFCTQNDVGFELVYPPESQWPDTTIHVYMRALKTDSNLLSLTEPICIADVFGAKFKSTMKLEVNEWSPTTKERTWRYEIVSRNLNGQPIPVKVFTIKFSADSGWAIN